MGADRHGFGMETLITQERRAKIFNSTVNQMEKRLHAFEKKTKKLTEAGTKLEMCVVSMM